MCTVVSSCNGGGPLVVLATFKRFLVGNWFWEIWEKISLHENILKSDLWASSCERTIIQRNVTWACSFLVFFNENQSAFCTQTHAECSICVKFSETKSLLLFNSILVHNIDSIYYYLQWLKWHRLLKLVRTDLWWGRTGHFPPFLSENMDISIVSWEWDNLFQLLRLTASIG